MLIRRIVCTVPEGQFSVQRRRELEAALRERCRQFFGASVWVAVFWRVAPTGQLFTDGRLSSAASVIVEANDGFDQKRRVEALHAISDDWGRITGNGNRHLTLALLDSSQLSGQLARERDRIRGLWRLRFGLQIAVSVLVALVARRPIAVSVNY